MAEYKESLPFYHTKAWKRVRALAMQRDCGMCQDCMERFRAGYGFKPRRAQMVHHLVPLKERPDLALELSNLRSLCYACHEKRHPDRGGGRRAEGEPARHSMRVIKV